MSLNRRHLAGSLISLVAAFALAACSNSATGSSTASSPASSGGSAAPVAGATDPAAASKKAYTGVVEQPPSSPVKPAANALAWVVSCGQQVPTCAGPAAAAVTAAKTAGWDVKLCDGKLNPQGWAACIRQGISAKATGIIVIGQDCNSFQAALQEAKAAGIPTIGAGGNDCDVTGGQKLFSATVQSLAKMTNQQWWAELGALQADWIIAKTNGKAQVLSVQFTDAVWGGWIQDGFTKELATCADCKVVSTLKVGNADVATGKLPQMFGNALLKAPTVNAVDVPLDGWFFAGLSQAVQSSGRGAQLAVVGAFGEPGNLDLIRKGIGEDATVAFNAEWIGWSGIDNLARVLAKQPAQPAGAGLQVIDANHNMPAAGETFRYEPAVDFEGAYKKDWGVE
jgi:ribose transport system substrate-binding protein